jgi:hypothetical protein
MTCSRIPFASIWGNVLDANGAAAMTVSPIGSRRTSRLRLPFAAVALTGLVGLASQLATVAKAGAFGTSCSTNQNLSPCPTGSPAIVGFSQALGAPPFFDSGPELAVTSSGSVYANGSPSPGMNGIPLAAPMVGIASPNPDDTGLFGNGYLYWLVAKDGGVFAFQLTFPYQGARFYGSMAGKYLAAPMVGIASTPDGGGYWLVAADGGVFAFGDAQFYGSVAGKLLAAPVVAIAATGYGLGYFLVGADGGIFAFGNAQFLASVRGLVDSPVIGMAVINRPVTIIGLAPEFFSVTVATAGGQTLSLQ